MLSSNYKIVGIYINIWYNNKRLQEGYLMIISKNNKNIKVITKNKLEYCSITISRAKVIRKLAKKFDISNTKTYNPPKLNWGIDRDLKLSLIVGFIDGDGCIGKQSYREDNILSLKCHSSWLDNIDIMAREIYSLSDMPYTCRTKINKRGYARVAIANNEVLMNLKRKVLELNLPVLKRKWDKIDENKIERGFTHVSR
jgi:hypothetical protein